MIKLYDVNNNPCQPIINYSDLTITEELNGTTTIEFSISGYENIATFIKVEGYLETEKDRFVIKEVNEDNDNNLKVYGIADTEELRGRTVLNYDCINLTASQAINIALSYVDNNTWTLQVVDTINRKRSVSFFKKTVWEIIQELTTLFHIELKYDTKNKKIYLYNYNSIGSNKGAYFYDDLNLNELTIERNSNDFATVLFPYGKDVYNAKGERTGAVNISSLNDGKYYISNYTYSNKKIRKYWIDDRYDNAEDLLEDAQFMLNEISKPYSSFSAKVVDLAKLDTQYSIFDYEIGDTITLKSKERNHSIVQRIVKIYNYPDNPENNILELSSRRKTLADSQALNKKFVDNVSDSVSSDGSINRVKDDSIDANTKIKNATITTAKIKDASITSAKIGNAQIGSAHIGEGVIGSAHIGDAQIISAKIKDGEITNAKIADGTITKAKIGTAQIGSAQIEDLAVTDAKIALATISGAKIANATIDSANIKNGAITTALIDTSAIGTAQIADGSITDAKIVGMTANKITAGTIDASNINVTNLDCANLTVGTINGSQIANGTIAMDNLSQTVIDNMSSGSGNKVYYQSNQPTNCNSGDLWYKTDSDNELFIYNGTDWNSYQFGSDAISSNSIIANHITSGAITTGKIATGAITTNTIASGSINADKISADAITSDKIATNSITTDKIVSEAITADKIASNSITANKIASNAITSDKISVTTLSGISANLGEVTAGKINGLEIVGGSITGTTISGGSISSSGYYTIDSVVGNQYAGTYITSGLMRSIGYGNVRDGCKTEITPSGLKVTNSNGYHISVDENSVSFIDSSGDDELYMDSSGVYATGLLQLNGTSIQTGSKIIVGGSVQPTQNGSWSCGSSSNRWSTVYGNDANFSGNAIVNGTLNVTKISSSSTYNNTSSYATNMYIGSSGVVYRTTKTSLRSAKDDIKPLQNDDLKAENLYNAEVVQFKYKPNILSKDDMRYRKDLVGFIIDDLVKVYPIAVDKDEKGNLMSWNSQYLIPPMLKLIQDQHKEIEQLKQRVDKLEGGNNGNNI